MVGLLSVVLLDESSYFMLYSLLWVKPMHVAYVDNHHNSSSLVISHGNHKHCSLFALTFSVRQIYGVNANCCATINTLHHTQMSLYVNL